MMKHYFYFLLFISLYGCENEIRDSFELQETYTISKDILAESIVQSLIPNLGNEPFKSFLKTEAMKQKDGDNDILFAEIINMNITSVTTRGNIEKISFRDLLKDGFEKRSTTRATTNLSFEETLRLVERDYPLLQISIPDTENVILESLNFNTTAPLITYVPEGFNENNPIDIIAYDKDGNVHILNTAIEPTVPVVVVGENERLLALSTEEFSLAKEIQPYLKTDGTIYVLRENEELFFVPNNSGSTNQTKKRDSTDLWDYITKAKFKDQKAMRKYESWVNGRPEVKVEILNNVLPSKKIRYDSKGWWEGNTRTLDSQIIKWDRGVVGEYITYYWSEEDGGSSQDKKIDLMITLPNGVTTTTSTTIKAGRYDDEIGTTYVPYSEVIPAGGKVYDPTGSNYFSFWVDLK